MKLLPKTLRLAALFASLGLGLAALCFWMMEGLDRSAHANPVPPQADVEVVDHGCSLPAGVIDVSQDVSLRCAVSVHNNGPSGPVGAEVRVDVVASPGCTVTPSSISVSVLLPVSVNVDVFPPWMTVHCAQPGSHQLEHSSTVSLTEPGVVDPDPTNNSLGPTPLPFEAVIPGVILVEIDIKPGKEPNTINLKSGGKIPVAVLTTAVFDALTVDPDAVLFEGAVAQPRPRIRDVDHDGDLDLLLRFRIRETDLVPGQTEGCLIGETYDGTPILGCDSIRTVP